MSLPPIDPAPDRIEILAPEPNAVAVVEPGTGMANALPVEGRRVPNFGHAALFLGFTAMLFLLMQLALVMLGLSPVKESGGAVTVLHPMLQIAVLAATYAGTLAAAWLFFPMIWHKPFGEGLQWNWAMAHSKRRGLLGLGLLLGAASAVASSLITQAKQPPVDQFFPTATAAWIMTIFGTLVAPVFEEIAFRGFLLPAFAIAFDWLRSPRAEGGYARWRASTGLSPMAWIFSAVLTSVLFVRIHADQIGNVWGPLLVLFCVSLVLTAVRIRLQSVAASVLVHATYNGLIFLTALIATGGYRHLDRMVQ
jgi:hypothetical protein